MTESERRWSHAVEIFRAHNRIEAFAVAGLLRSYGIPADVDTNSANCVYPNLAFAEGMPVLVGADDAPQALRILEEEHEVEDAGG